MAYTKCVLGGYSFKYNAPQHQNPGVRSVQVTEALAGRYFTDWGQDVSRQEIVMTWPTMGASVFASLLAKAKLGGTLAFTDNDGTAYTVIALPPTYDRTTPRATAYLNVQMKLYIVSSP